MPGPNREMKRKALKKCCDVRYIRTLFISVRLFLRIWKMCNYTENSPSPMEMNAQLTFKEPSNHRLIKGKIEYDQNHEKSEICIIVRI